MKALLLISILLGVSRAMDLFDTYSNPNPRPYAKCDAHDLIKLSACSNEVLTKLDDCKPDDLACECCALQSIDQSCYNLCPNNPSNNFLSVLFDDCAALNDVNACGLPFKKQDQAEGSGLVLKQKVKVQAPELENSITLKSKVSPHDLSPDHRITVNLLEPVDEATAPSASPSPKPIPSPSPPLVQLSNGTNQTVLRMITFLLLWLTLLTNSIIERCQSMVSACVGCYSHRFISIIHDLVPASYCLPWTSEALLNKIMIITFISLYAYTLIQLSFSRFVDPV